MHAKQASFILAQALHICARYGCAKATRRIPVRLEGVKVDAVDQYEVIPLMEAVRQDACAGAALRAASGPGSVTGRASQ